MIDVRVWIYAAKFVIAAEDKSLHLDGRNVWLDIFISQHPLKLFPSPQLFSVSYNHRSSYIGGHEFAHLFWFLFSEGGVHAYAWQKDETSVPSRFVESVALSKGEGKQTHCVLLGSSDFQNSFLNDTP